MFYTNINEINLSKWNTILKKNINLDSALDCFILVSSENNILAENILNNILENIIEKISKEDTYNDFWIALENINSYLKTWREDQIWEENLDIVISILNENNYMFSNIWKSFVCMLNSNSEVIELTEKSENKKDFLFISNWNLATWEIVISSTLNILKYISKSDITDWMILSDDISVFNKNIVNILKTEIIEKNYLLNSIKYENKDYLKDWETNNKTSVIKDWSIKLMDKQISKNTMWFFLKIWDKLKNQSKTTKNTIFFSTIAIWLIILYFIISSILWIATQETSRENAKTELMELKQTLTEVSENISNPIIFQKKIKEAEEKIKVLEEKKLFLEKLTEINDQLNSYKKQFNKIEIFEFNENNKIFGKNNLKNPEILKNTIWITELSDKYYIVLKNWVIWPIYNRKKEDYSKVYTFNDLKKNEYFIDSTFINQNIYLLTNTSKIVKFSKTWKFSFANVEWQTAWEKMKSIKSYYRNFYTIWKDDNQIYKHTEVNWNFKTWKSYLKKDDLKNLWEIIWVAIDWWFYIVAKNLKIVKFFSDPYRIEKLYLNKFPKNYILEKWKKFDIKTNNKLRYVYLLLNDKIWILKPNSTNYKNTQNLNYIAQIEWDKTKILDFYIIADWEILVLSEKGLNKLKFEISDDKIILK